MLSPASDKAKLFAKNFSKNSNLDDSGISLPVFPSRTNLKLHNISVTPKMVKKVITNLDSSKASGPDCIPVVVLKNCELELSYILAKLFNNCLKESCFLDCWKVSLVVPVFKNVGERSTAKNYCPVSLLSVVSKVFEKLVNNRIVDHLEKCSIFYDFQYGFRSSRSTADLLTVVSDRIARAFNRSGATRAVALDISKAFNRAWHAGLLHKLKSYGISGQIFGLISSFGQNQAKIWSLFSSNVVYIIYSYIDLKFPLRYFYNQQFLPHANNEKSLLIMPVSLFFTTLDLIWPKFCKTTHILYFFVLLIFNELCYRIQLTLKTYVAI